MATTPAAMPDDARPPPPEEGPRERAEAFGALPQRLLVSALTLGAFAALLLLRAHDDNRLTSWRWVFAGANPLRLYAFVGIGVLLAHAAARLPIPRRRPGAILFVLAFGAAACCWGEPEVIVDASRYFTEAKHLEVYGIRHFLAEWGTGVPAWTDLPLVPFLQGLVFRLLGESRVHVQAFGALLFAASVVLTRRIGEELFDAEVGYAAGALLLAIPYLLTQVPLMLVDVPTLFFLTLAVFAFLRALSRGGAGRIALAAACVALAALSKYSTWVLLSTLPVAWLVRWRARGPRSLRAGAWVLLAAGVLVLGALLSHAEVHGRQLALLLEYQAPGLRRWGESFLSTFLFQVHPFLTAAAVLSLVVALRRRDPAYVVVLWPVLLLLVLDVRRIRYWVPVFPMLALLGAYGLRAIRAGEVRRLVVACAVASSLVVGLEGYQPFLRGLTSANLAAAGAYLDTLDERRVEVLTPSRAEAEVNPAVAVPILDLFTTKELVYRYEPPPPPPPAEQETSPLRFTWEYRNPGYYAADGAAGEAAVVVISDDVEAPLPEDVRRRIGDRRLARVFAAGEDPFQYRTLVRVYRGRAGP